MNAIRATWVNGQIVLAESVDWPEGSKLLVEPVAPNGQKIGMTEEEWRDDPESIAAWIAAVEQIEPLIWEDGERRQYEEYCKQMRTFNLDAVRKQMAEMPEGKTP